MIAPCREQKSWMVSVCLDTMTLIWISDMGQHGWYWTFRGPGVSEWWLNWTYTFIILESGMAQWVNNWELIYWSTSMKQRKIAGNSTTLWKPQSAHPYPSDIPSVTRPYLLILLKWFYPPGTKYSNRSLQEPFSFKPPHWLTWVSGELIVNGDIID